MIKINLLKSFNVIESEYLRELDDIKNVRSDFFKKVIIFLIGPLGLFLYQNYNIPQLTEQKNALIAEQAQLVEFNQRKEAMANEISKYEEDKKRLNRQTQFLDKISKERLFPVELITKIKELIPNDVWLDSITTRGNIVEIQGESGTERDVTEFESKLNTIQVLKNVKLIDSSIIPNTLKPDLVIRKFLITSEFAIEAMAPTEEAIK